MIGYFHQSGRVYVGAVHFPFTLSLSITSQLHINILSGCLRSLIASGLSVYLVEHVDQAGSRGVRSVSDTSA